MKRLMILAMAALLVTGAAAAWWPAEACVGKTIFVGRLPGKQQEVLAEIFSWMVSERTGTSIQIKPFVGSREVHGALEAAEVDVYLEDQATALREILGLPVPGTLEAMRTTVRREYEQRFNFIWLEPWGLTTTSVRLAGPAVPATAAPVAPVVRKDTLKKFPALSRLINKLSGVIDDEAMARLVQESESRPAREVVKRFLKEKRLI